jgi:hypothetical protein
MLPWLVLCSLLLICPYARGFNIGDLNLAVGVKTSPEGKPGNRGADLITSATLVGHTPNQNMKLVNSNVSIQEITLGDCLAWKDRGACNGSIFYIYQLVITRLGVVKRKLLISFWELIKRRSLSDGWRGAVVVQAVFQFYGDSARWAAGFNSASGYPLNFYSDPWSRFGIERPFGFCNGLFSGVLRSFNCILSINRRLFKSSVLHPLGSSVIEPILLHLNVLQIEGGIGSISRRLGGICGRLCSLRGSLRDDPLPNAYYDGAERGGYQPLREVSDPLVRLSLRAVELMLLSFTFLSISFFLFFGLIEKNTVAFSMKEVLAAILFLIGQWFLYLAVSRLYETRIPRMPEGWRELQEITNRGPSKANDSCSQRTAESETCWQEQGIERFSSCPVLVSTLGPPTPLPPLRACETVKLCSTVKTSPTETRPR